MILKKIRRLTRYAEERNHYVIVYVQIPLGNVVLYYKYL